MKGEYEVEKNQRNLFTHTFTATPLRSADTEAAEAEVLATVLVLVSLRWVFDVGMRKLLPATCRKTSFTSEKRSPEHNLQDELCEAYFMALLSLH